MNTRHVIIPLLSASFVLLSGCISDEESDETVRDEERSELDALTLDPRGYATREALVESGDDYGAARDAHNRVQSVHGLMLSIASWIRQGDTEGDSEEGSPLTRDCTSGGGSATLEESSEEGRYTGEVTLSNCGVVVDGFGKVELSGRYQETAEEENVSATTLDERSQHTFDLEGTYYPGEGSKGQPLTIVGEQERLLETSDVSTTLTIETKALEYLAGNTYYAVADGKHSTHQSSSQTFITLAGLVVSSELDGFSEFSTPVRLRFEIADDGGLGCAEVGVIRLESYGQVEVRFGDSTGTDEDVAVEVNNNITDYQSCEGKRELEIIPAPGEEAKVTKF